MISNHPRIVREAGAQVKCRMCGCEFKIRNRRQRRCPDCGAVELPLNDSLTMQVDPKAIRFVQDLIERFSRLPDVQVSVTVSFSKGASA